VCLCLLLTNYPSFNPKLGTLLAQYLDNFDENDRVLLEGFHPKKAEQKIEEKLEALLSPDATSLFVKIVTARKANEAKKQKLNVVMLLDRYVWFA